MEIPSLLKHLIWKIHKLKKICYHHGVCQQKIEGLLVVPFSQNHFYATSWILKILFLNHILEQIGILWVMSNLNLKSSSSKNIFVVNYCVKLLFKSYTNSIFRIISNTLYFSFIMIQITCNKTSQAHIDTLKPLSVCSSILYKCLNFSVFNNTASLRFFWEN